MQTFDYDKVYSPQEAFDAASSREAAVFLAGGTDLLVQMKQGKRLPRHVIDVKNIREMGGLAVSENVCSIGALTTVRTVETAASVAERVPLLTQAAANLGSVQVRHRATVGGNICNASPSADMAPALLALDAQAVIFGKKGQRNVELADFFLRSGETVLANGELLIRLEIPLPHRQYGSVYYKLSTRNAMDLALVGVAVLIETDGEDKIVKARIALGAVAPTPIRVPPAETRLEGARLSLDAARESAELAAAILQPDLGCQSQCRIPQGDGQSPVRTGAARCVSPGKTHHGGEELMSQPIELRVNGEHVRFSGDASRTLLDFLREDLNLTGTKKGCDQGDCGACTVLLDGQPVNACLILVSEIAGREVLTIEGLSRDGELHPVQRAFVDHNALQCGFCTPGMILTAVGLLNENPNPTREETRRYLEGNLCRCTGYGKIVEAIQAVARGRSAPDAQVTRLEAPSKTTGSATFGADLKRPGMLVGKILRSTVPHALIKGIKTEKALSLPGVAAVVTARDFPDVQNGFYDPGRGGSGKRQNPLYRRARGSSGGH